MRAKKLTQKSARADFKNQKNDFSEIVVHGFVESGKGIGRKFGFPTLNLIFETQLNFSHGVYAGLAEDDFQVLIHYGPRPTIDDVKPSFEVFFLNYPEGRIFKTLSVNIFGKIRNVQKFDSLEALAKQIEKDRETAVIEYFQRDV